MLKFFIVLIAGVLNIPHAYSQHTPVDRHSFFSDESVIEAQFSTDIKKLRASKNKNTWQPANIKMKFSDSSIIDENIRVTTRGIYRKQNCDIAALMLDFKTKKSPLLSDLKKLKLVGGCFGNASSEALLLKEYVAYKIYNILTPMSFRVRLVHVTYIDSQQKVKPYTQYAFLIENVDDLAKRNGCREITKGVFATESTDRKQITFVSIFQFMIGNTDWSVPNYHNIKLITPVSDLTARPYPVPYDFDYSGLVNAPYAVPAEGLEIKYVTERSYRGYTRSIEELEAITSVFNEKRDSIMQYINSFELLRASERKNMANYISQFYDIIKDRPSIKYAFITNAVSQ